jgi:hypothetical protein
LGLVFQVTVTNRRPVRKSLEGVAAAHVAREVEAHLELVAAVRVHRDAAVVGGRVRTDVAGEAARRGIRERDRLLLPERNRLLRAEQAALFVPHHPTHLSAPRAREQTRAGVDVGVVRRVGIGAACTVRARVARLLGVASILECAVLQAAVESAVVAAGVDLRVRCGSGRRGSGRRGGVVVECSVVCARVRG